MQIVAGLAVSLLKSYLVKLATKEFLHWVLFQVAEAITESTETKEDDQWLAKIKEMVESDA